MTDAQNCSKCGTSINVNDSFCNKCGSNTHSSGIISERSEKSAITALLLCLFLGFLGIHRFYAGRIWTGLLMLITLGGFGLWSLIDIIIIASCEFKDSRGKPLEFVKGKGSLVKRVLLILFTIFIGFMLLFALIIGISFYATRNVVAAVQGQLDALKAGDINKAYSYTSKEFQKHTNFENFKVFLSEAPMLANHKSISIPDRQIENDIGEVKANIEGTDGKKYAVEYQLVHEDGQWKIIYINVVMLTEGSDTKEGSEADKSPETHKDQNSHEEAPKQLN